MTIAELFVKIGLTGAEGAGKDLAKVGKGMEGLKESALATKIALAAVIAGLERMVGFASQVGMDLNKFAMTTGLDQKVLQNWQYMGQKFDVSGQEVSQTITGLQDKISDFMLGKGMPEGAAALGIKMTRDPFELMEQLTQKMKVLPPDVARNLAKSFGISDNVFQMMRSVDMQKDRIAKKNIISDREVKNLTEINKQWKDMWFNVKTAAIKLVANQGMPLIGEFGNALQLLQDAAKYIGALIEKFSSLKIILIAIAAIVAIMFSPFTAAIAAATALIAILSDIQKFRTGKDSVIADVLGAKSLKDVTLESVKGGVTGLAKRGWSALSGDVDKMSAMMFGPSPTPAAATAGGGTQNIEQNTTVHLHGVHDPEAAANAIKRETNNAARSIASLTRSN